MNRTVLLLLLAGLPCVAQSGIEAIFAPLADAKSPGASVLVIKGGRPFYERSFGVRDLKSYSKIGDGTDFRLASMTKQFTAMAIMLLVHDRKLQYEDRLTTIFPDFPEYGRAITIRHLLTHTSGLPDYEELMDKSWTETRQIQDQDVLDLLKRQKKGKFAPGASWSYSNSGYVVLGLIVAKTGGEPFGDFLHRRIFEPLHMKHTLAFVNGQNAIPGRAYGHIRKDGAFVQADQSSTSATLGDGGIYSNVNDLAKWDEALRKNSLLSKNEMSAALAPIRLANGALPNWPAEHSDDNLAPGKPVSYGFGWFLDAYNGRPRMWHTGSTSGFRTVIQRFTDEDLTILILANRTDLDVAKLSLQIADLLDAREVVPPEMNAITPGGGRSQGLQAMHRYSDLQRQAAEFIAHHAPRGPVLVLAPSQAAAAEVARAACSGALLGVQRLAFRDLVLELAGDELYRRELMPVGRFVREALAARVTAATELTYLAPVAAFPGFPRALTDTFEELRLNSVGPAQLRECGQSGPDLAKLLSAYEAELADRRFADHAMRVKLALSRPEQTSPAVVTLDLAPRTRLERDLLASVMRSARATLALRIAPEAAPTASSLESLQRHLFFSDPVPPREEDGSVAIFSTSGEALECVEMARRIGAADVPYDATAILLRSPERHQPLVLEALRRAGIPAHCTQGLARPDVTGRSFLALLYCAEEGLSASRFAEYLSLGQMREDEEPHTPAVWERLIVDAAVIGGPERWDTRLHGLREELHRRYREEQDPALERKIPGLENLQEMALPIVRKLAALPARATWGEWIAALLDLAEFTLRDPERVSGMLEQLQPMADVGPVGLWEVLLVLGPRLNTLRLPPKDSRYGKVWVGGIEEARGMAFRSVFLPGVNEGLFPRPPAEDPLLLESQRAALGVELRADDTELLRVAAACASERLTLSFSRLDLLTGRERVPSFYAFAAHRAAGGPEIDVRQFEHRARAATETRIGWPAPVDAADAIDDAEFDLATLAPRSPGSGQYLKRLPGRAVDALRARWMRWHKPWKAADGLIVEEIGSDALKPYLLSERAWSPSALQQYARCPYRFALHGIYGLRPAERPGPIQRMDPATRGQIYHEVQFELLRDLAAREMLPVTAANLSHALERLDDALTAVTHREEAKLAPAIPQIWRSEVQSLRADLRGWLQHRAAAEPDWTPEFYELSFGLHDPVGRDPRSSKDPVEIAGGFHLKGSIDLVERHRGGVLRVVDHKTGRVPEPKPDMLGGGEILQPVLYAISAEQLLGGPVSFGRLYYSTIAQNYQAIDVPLNDWSRRRAAQALAIIDAAMRDGFLPAAPRKDGCKGCEYLPVCGPYEEERVTEKSQPELKGLKDLRGWR